MDLIQLYSVPIWQSEYPDFEENKENFLEIVKKFKNENPSIETSKSNIFGYQSENKLQKVEDLRPLFEFICGMVYKACADLDFTECDVVITSAWLNVNNSRQCMNSEHIHGDVFSGVFYVKCPDGSGKLSIKNLAMNGMWEGLEFVSQKNQFTSELVRIEPSEGKIILFPSYLPHSVETNDHDDERISISFNVKTLPKGTIKRL